MDKIFSALIPGASRIARGAVAETLSLYTKPVVAFVASRGTTIRILDEGERYADVSHELSRLGIDVDPRSAPPAGLFVVQERRVYLRRLSPMLGCLNSA